LNAFTSSQLTINTAIGASTSSLNTFSGSQITKNSTLATYTASVDTKFTAVGASTSSLNSFSSSQETKNNTLATYTASVDTKFATLGSQSGSWITESETGSFAYINKDNSWSVNQNFTNITAVSASFRYVQTLYETSSVIYSSGSNQLGDATNDVQTLIGTVIVSGSQEITGSLRVTGTLTASLQQGYSWVGNGNNISTLVSTSSFGTPTNLGPLNTFTASQETKDSTLATYTASIDTKFTAIGASTSSLNTFTSSQATINTNLNLSSSKAITTASVNLNTITFTKGDASTFNITVNTGSGGGSTINTGSFATTGSNSFNGNQTITGSLNVRTITTLGLNATPSTVNTGSGTSLYFLNQDINGGASPSIYNITAGWVMSGTGITDGTVTSTSNDDNGFIVNITSGNVVNGNSYIGTGPYAAKLIVTGGVFTDGNGFQSPGGFIVQNQDGTGNPYGGMGIVVDTATDPTNVFSTVFIAGATSEAGVQIGLSSYNLAYPGETVPTIYGGGYYDGGQGYGASDTTMTFYSSSIQNWKPTQFKAPVQITGSLNLSSTFTASLQQGYAWVGNASGKTIAVATSSFAGTTFNTGSFATTGSNSFNGNQRITGSLTMSGSIIFVDRSGYDQNVYLGLNALGMGNAGAQPLARGNTISVAIGNGAMRFASGSSQNIAIGNNALLKTTGSLNFAMGSEALSSNTSGTDNFAMGLNTLTSNISSSYNIAIGNNALSNNQTDSNVAIGGGALEDTTHGNVNIAIGRSAAQKNTRGTGNVVIGANAMQNATGSINNIVIGNASMQNATSTDDNVAIGVGTLYATQGSKNTAIGRNALGSDTTGQQNTAIGYNAGYAITTGNHNTLIGSATGSTSWNNVIALSDGQGNIEAIYSGSAWSMNAPVNFTTGSNQQAGTAVLNGGNPGVVTVSNSLVTANSIIMLTKQTLTNAHMVAVSAKSGGSFTITSNGNGDADTVGWFIINNS
jgi:hypothetical protein